MTLAFSTENHTSRLNELETQEFGFRYTLERVFVNTAIADNTATDLFRIETTNETGSTDGGVYTVFVQCLVAHSGENDDTNAAVKSLVAHWGRAVIDTGGTGVNSAVSEISETAAAATNSIVRNVSTVTLTLQENTEYQNDVQITVDLTGSGVDVANVVTFVRLIYYGFLTPPTLTQL